MDSAYDLKYHVMCITKYRKWVLRGEIAIQLREFVQQIHAMLAGNILSGHIAVDYVHLLVSVPSHVSVSQSAQRIKWHSNRKMLEEFDEWNRQF